MSKSHEEIERKFLVNTSLWTPGKFYKKVMQGYLNRDPERTVRVRRTWSEITGNTNDPPTVCSLKSYITIKSKNIGPVRKEIEMAITEHKSKAVFPLCEGLVVEKQRHCETINGMLWEVDIFLGDLAGLVMAEIELKSADQQFVNPVWLGREVTDDPRFYNSNLSAANVAALLASPQAFFASPSV